MNKKKIVNTILIFFISYLILGITFYIRNNFSDEYFEQIIFSLYTLKGTSMNVIGTGFLKSMRLLIILSLITIIIYFIVKKINKNLITKYIIKIRMIVLIFSIIISLNNIGLFSYLKNYTMNSKLIENEYVDPKNVEITFPEKKQNLIYIYVESLENSGMSMENGGFEDKSVIKNLEGIALNNQNFSNSNKLGGAKFNQGNSWTAASIIGQTSGIPLKVGLTNNLTSNNKFLSGTYTLGEILEKNGYKNYFIMGSDASFGARSSYLKDHGNYTIYDYKWARENNKIPKDYQVWWGYEDSKLFKFAKEELVNISRSDEPFNFSMLTADTHFPDGYIDSSCKNTFSKHYLNSYACEDKMLSEFIKWIEKQDFYKNTTIIITGDHLTMQKNVYKTNDKKKRSVYNTIINSRRKIKNNKNRSFTVMDMYPTTLSAIGANIKGDRLGLGTNLYSGKKTLSENYGINNLDRELKKQSKFYRKNILKED